VIFLLILAVFMLRLFTVKILWWAAFLLGIVWLVTIRPGSRISSGEGAPSRLRKTRRS
jgi:hypothetical protein